MGMETKRCRKCGCIYPAEDMCCPNCGSKKRVKNGKRRSKLWLWPVTAVLILIISGVTGKDEMLGLALLAVIIWISTLFYRKALKGIFTTAREEIEIDKNPVAARLLSYNGNSTTKAPVLRTAARGAVGGLLAGPVGMAIGVATTKHKTETTGCSATFLVDYESGRRGTETVDVSSARFEKLIALEENRRA